MSKQVTSGEIPAFYAETFEAFGGKHSSVNTAHQAFLALRNLHAEHRGKVEELASDLRTPNENRRHLSDQIAARTASSLSKMATERVEPVRQELKRARYARDYTSKQIQVDPARQQFLWTWLASLKESARAKVIAAAMQERDLDVLPALLLAPKAVAWLEDGQRSRIGALVNPSVAVEVEQLEQALDILQATYRLIEGEAERASDAELQRRREVGEKLAQEIRERQEQAAESGGPTLDAEQIAKEVKEILEASDPQAAKDLEVESARIAAEAFGDA